MIAGTSSLDNSQYSSGTPVIYQVNGTTGWWNEVRWDGRVVAAHPSEAGPLEADGKRTHAFTVNLGPPDELPHTLEVWLDVGDRTSSDTGGTFMPQRRRRATVTHPTPHPGFSAQGERKSPQP